MTAKQTVCRDCGAPRDMSLRYALCRPCYANQCRAWNTARKPVTKPVVEKCCPKCARVLPLSSFNLNRHNPDGHAYYCRECRAFLRSCKREVRIKTPKAVTCRVCGETKWASEFYRSADGDWRRVCKTCSAGQAKARRERRKRDPQYLEREASRMRASRLRKRMAAYELLLKAVRS